MADTITFKSSNDKDLTGTVVTIPGYEQLDFVFVQNGFLAEVYELATGMQVIDAKGFSIKKTISDVQAGFARKRISDIALLKKIHGSQHQFAKGFLKVKNHSPAYEKYVAAIKLEHENKPFMYDDHERAKIMQLIDTATELGLHNIDILRLQLNSKTGGTKVTIEAIKKTFEWNVQRHHARQYRFRGEPLPAGMEDPDYKQTSGSWENMVSMLNYGRKRDITKLLPKSLLNMFHKLYQLQHARNKEYGYHRFYQSSVIDLIRLAIHTKQKKHTTQQIIDAANHITEEINAIKKGTQPYFIEAHEAIYLKKD